MLDVYKLKMVKQSFKCEVRVGSSHFFLSVTVIPTHSFQGVNNGHR